MFTIELNYVTGNSFNTSEETDILDMKWDNKEVARENLQRIKEHYQQHLDINSCRKSEDKDKILLGNKDKEWFNYGKKYFDVETKNAINTHYISRKSLEENTNYIVIPDRFLGENTIILKSDNGDKNVITAFWVGHFEQLIGAKIVLVDGEDLDSFFV